MSKLKELLDAHDACEPARNWIADEKIVTPSEAWLKCRNPGWLLWAINAMGLRDDRKHRLFTSWCARNTPLADGRTTWDLLTDQRSRAAVEVAERFAVGSATRDELAAAGKAANAAWKAAASLGGPFMDAAAAAAAAAGNRPSWIAVRDAAWAAAEFAANNAIDIRWSAALDAGMDAAKAAQANHIRRLYDSPFAKMKRRNVCGIESKMNRR